MIKNNPEKMVAFLNELVEADGEALSNLMDHRVPCNDKLADHPTVQVAGPKGQTPIVGLIGILNGFFGTYDDGPKKGWGPIAAVVDDKDLRTLIRFEITENDVKKKTSDGPVGQDGQVLYRRDGKAVWEDPPKKTSRPGGLPPFKQVRDHKKRKDG